MTVPILSDQPHQTDALAFSRYADLLTNIIMDAEALPFTIGIFGDWGSGKTTLMRMIQSQLEDECKILWFNAWKYDDKQYLSKAFLKVIHDKIWASNELSAEVFKDVLQRVGDWAGKTFVDKPLGSIFFETFSLDPVFQNLLEETTQEMIDRYVGKTGRLVIFVDDLDRCLPENTITILETLKQFLDHARCIIVLGIDKETIEMAIEHRYPFLNMSGKDYLEKIVQIPFAIPQPNQHLMRQYLSGCHLLNGKKLGDFSQLSKIVLSGAGSNMRRLKRLVNQLNLAMGMAGIEKVDEMEWAMLVKLLVLQTRFSDFFNVVKYHSEAIFRFHQLLSAQDDKARDNVLNDLPQLKAHLDNQSLCTFFEETQKVTTCTDTKQVEKLLQLVIVAKS